MNADFWFYLAIGIVWVMGFYTLFEPGMIFGELGDWIEWIIAYSTTKKFAEMAVKPLFRCPPCCASVHGSAIWYLAGGSLALWIPFIVCLCGCLSLVTRIFPQDD